MYIIVIHFNTVYTIEFKEINSQMFPISHFVI